MLCQCHSERFGIKPCIGIIEKSINLKSTILELRDQFIDTRFKLIYIVMIALLWLGHGKRDTLIICKVKRVSGFTFFPSWIFNGFPTSDGRCMRTINVTDRKVENMFVLISITSVN